VNLYACEPGAFIPRVVKRVEHYAAEAGTLELGLQRASSHRDLKLRILAERLVQSLAPAPATTHYTQGSEKP
jgi:hypothetical protein